MTLARNLLAPVGTLLSGGPTSTAGASCLTAPHTQRARVEVEDQAEHMAAAVVDWSSPRPQPPAAAESTTEDSCQRHGKELREFRL